MKIDNNSLTYRLVAGICLTFTLVALAVLAVGNRIVKDIIEDYHHLVAEYHTSETRRIFQSALAELTTARLLDNQEVVSAQQQTLLEAIRLNWQQREVGGVIVNQDGAIILTTLTPEPTQRLVARFDQKFVEVMDQGAELFGPVELIHPWEWRVMTVITDHGYNVSSRVAPLLVPLLVLGPLAMMVALFFILRRQVRQPVQNLIAFMAREEAVPRIGVTEFDQIGEAFNLSLTRIQERSAALSQELAERRHAEEVIRGQEARIRLLLNSTAEGIYGIDENGVCTFCNSSCCRLLGYAETELLGRNLHNLIHHCAANGTPCSEDDCIILRSVSTGQPAHSDSEVFWRSDGSCFPVEYFSHPIQDNVTIRGAVIAFIDITTRKQAEEALLAEKNKFEATIAGMGDGVCILDRNFTVLYQNDVHIGYVGAHQGAVCYQAFEHNDHICPGCPISLTFADGRVHNAERRIMPAGTAEPRYFEINASPLRDGTGAIVGGIEVVRESTERKKAEDQLIHAQKMEGIGHLAGGVAHDFNNVLNVVQGYSDLLRMLRSSDAQVNEYIGHIQEAVRRGSTITRQILSFSRKEAMTIQTIDLNELVSALEKMLRRLIREDIEIRIKPAGTPLMISADPGQIDQVLINLATNASHAMPGGGIFSMETRRIAIDDAFIKAHGFGIAGPYALIVVTDTGLGMTEPVRQRIFEPFFTTKEAGKGTGLGLSMVYGIIRKHHGFINVYSEPGCGTVFRIYLPLAASAAPAPNGKTILLAGKEDPTGAETILVAEDDPSLRLWLETWISMKGYTVIAAVDGEDAAQKFDTLGDSIDMVLLDGIMPRKNGKEALLEMRERRPDLKAIILSGYAEDVFTQRELLELQVAFLEKPVDPSHLMRKIRQVLDEG